LKLRDHPLMTRKSGMPTWPPIWTTTVPGQHHRPAGEIGVLERVFMHDLFDNKIFLFIQHEGHRYMGSMHFDDPAFCYQVFELIRSRVGRSIKDIGGLDLFHTL
jgi:hypothetical protein